MSIEHWYRRHIKGMETLEEAEKDVMSIGSLIGYGNVGLITTAYIREVVEGKFIISLKCDSGQCKVTSKVYQREII